MPVLSETLSNARRTGVSTRSLAYSLMPKLFEFLAQRAAIDAQDGCRTALIALHMAHHDFEQRLFHFTHHKVV